MKVSEVFPSNACIHAYHYLGTQNLSPQSYGFYVTFNAWISSVIARAGLDEFLQIMDWVSSSGLAKIFKSRPTKTRMNWALLVLLLCQLAQLWFLFKFNREYNHLDGLGCEGNENYEGMGSRVTWMSVLCLLTSNSARCYSI